MESVFVTENPTDIDLFVNECNEVTKVKIGEIFQLNDNTLSMCCLHCSQEFHYFTEFSLHIQEHLFCEDIAAPNGLQDSVRSYHDCSPQIAEHFRGHSEDRSFDRNEIFDADLELIDKWATEKIQNNSNLFEPDINVKSVEKLPEISQFVEGTDYDRSNGNFRCLICSHQSTEWESLQKHLLTHSSASNILCPIYSKGFTTVSYVRKYVNRTHKMKITAEEIKSAQTISDFSDSKRHFENIQMAFSVTPSNLNNRIENPQKNFECFDCHKSFTGLSSLRIHLKLHSGIKYSCPYCDKLFAMRSYVRDHIVALHGIKREEIPKDSIRQATDSLISQSRPIVKWFECNLCKNQYNSKQNLRQHMKTHTTGSFLCVTCGAVYKSIANLRHHMERHQANANNRHKCLHSLCNKTHPTRRYMLSHYRTIHLRKPKPKKSINTKNHKLNDIMTVQNSF